MINSVPLLDLKAQYEKLRDEVEPVIEEVCESQWFVMGPKVTRFEEEVAEYSQCTRGIGVSSGTDALLVALMALDVGPGDAVITTPYSFFATAGVIARLGAQPVFCDIDAQSFNLDPDALERLAADKLETTGGETYVRDSGSKVKVLMPVHLYGQTAEIEPMLEFAADRGMRIVEDAAQAIGSEFSDGSRAGSRGAIGCFSFFPSKNLGAFGDAGMCTTNDDELAEKLSVLRLHGGSPKYYHSVIGGNFRLDALQAAVLSVKLRYLDEWTTGRQENAAYYDRAFSEAGLVEFVTTPARKGGQRHIFNQYNIRARNRDALREHLGKANIGTEIYYPVPLHLQKCFSYLGYKVGDCPVSEKAAAEALAIPVYPELSREHLDYVVASIAAFYGK